jgi:large subunit ribosomal protein L4
MAASQHTAAVVGKTGKPVPLADEMFGLEMNQPLLHEVVKAEAAARRAGTASSKTRGQVRGGGAKPYRQKGTGRARQGTISAPQFRGGGAVFGPTPRSYAVKVNRKAARKARAIGLSQHARAGSIGVFDASTFTAPKTKDALALIADWRTARPLVVCVSLGEADAALSFRNLPKVVVVAPNELEVTDLLWARSLLVSQSALEQLSSWGPIDDHEEVAS